ncbi:MAG: hypothetical protein LUC37_07385 [Prevotella sp.]|nr:hypothetical protein [Prevotella sp.]
MKTKFLLGITFLLVSASISAQVTLTQSGRQVTMKNDKVQFTIDTSGRMSNFRLTESGNLNVLSSNGVYFDYTGDDGNLSLSPSELVVVREEEDYCEVLYRNTSANLQFDQGYILRTGDSGFYTYVVLNGTEASAKKKLQEVRVCTRLGSQFLNGYVDDKIYGTIPSNDEMSTAEKNEIQDATYRLSDGSIYTKYDWGQYIVNDSVHGLMNSSSRPTGVWNIACSHEYVNGGPMRQELTAHATSKSPITIQMLQGEHFGASAQYFGEQEKKIYGPMFIYINRADSYEELVADAKREAHEQQEAWPFEWFSNDLYPLDRATVKGHLNVTTWQTNQDVQMVLAEPGSDPYTQGKSYIFWGKTDKNGDFEIKNVRKGEYTLYGWATKYDVTDELQVEDIVIDSENVDLGTIDWTPTCLEHRLWMIGENNRLADGFHLSDSIRAYGTWDWVPANLTYKIGESDPTVDWWYAQTQSGTWTIEFDLDQEYSGDALITFSLAGSSNSPSVTVYVNGENVGKISGYDDGGIRRSTILSGRHSLSSFSFPASYLHTGTNTVDLTMSGKSKGGFQYDCIKLEAGEVVTGISILSKDENTSKIEIYSLSGIKMGTFDSFEETGLKGIYIYRKGSKTGKIVL